MRRGRRRSIAVVGGGLAGLEFAVTAAERGAAVELFEPGSSTRTRHMDWDTTSHAGDEKVRSWTTAGWGAGGGLSRRLGGRSLCYHGVLIGLEPPALASWDDVWADRLADGVGGYDSVLDGLRADFPELEASEEHAQLAAAGLEHVPQAARIGPGGLFEAYTPLARALELRAAGRIRVTRGAARGVVSGSGGCAVDVTLPSGAEERSGFDTCVLASSAIGNVQLLASSLQRDITTTITDHFCVGAFVRLPPGPSLAPFRHRMLWSGYAAVPELGMNVFVLERPALSCGSRIVQLQGVIEQPSGPSSYSELQVRVLPNGVRTHIRASVSDADRSRLDEARAEIRRRAEWLAGGAVVDVLPGGASTKPATTATKPARSDFRWFGHDDAYVAVTSSGIAGAFSEYEVQYGAFEHEACTHPIGPGGPVPVSRDLEVLALPGVHVAGPGAFPRLGVANPALTIIAMSRWLGERIAASADST